MTATPACSLESVASPTWEGPTPRISVVLSTWGRASFLAELIACLERQSVPASDVEVVIVDDASPDGTWATLSAVASGTSLRLLAARLPSNSGAAAGRNTGVSLGRAPIVAFTDDDCLPTPGWLSAMLDGFARGVDTVQGRTLPDPAGEAAAGPWDHSIWVTGPTPFFETCNVGYRRTWLNRVGGFDSGDVFINRRRISPFGEDAVLGAKVIGEGGRRLYAPDALVHHRYLPGSYRSHLQRRWQVGEFPGLVRRSTLVSDALWHRVFLSRRTAMFDLAAASAATAVASRRPLLLVGMVPWLRECRSEATRRPRPAGLRRLGQVAVGDAVAFVALARGSVQHRRLVL